MKLLKYFLIGLKSIITFPKKFLKYFFIGLIEIITLIPKYIIKGLSFLIKRKNITEKEKKMEQKFIPTIIIILSITTYLLTIFILTRWYVQNERSKNFTNDLDLDITNQEQLEENTPNQYQDLSDSVLGNGGTYTLDDNFLNVNLNYYLTKNPETVGWFQINGTNINYPIVQHNDNSFYLEHDFYQRKTNIGWIFGDYRDNFIKFENNTIIYGHNLINRTMLGQIPYMLKKNWFNNPYKKYIKLSTKTTNSIWEIFSVYKINPTTDYLQVKFNSMENYTNFLNKIKERSEQPLETTISNTDKIITISTCDDTGTKRIVVHAKLIKIEDKIT